MDYVAVDLTRVVLQPMVGGTDYINSSWVPGYSRSDQYILSQVWVFLSQDYLLTSLLSTLAPPLLASSGTWSTRCLQYNQLRLLIKDLSDGDKYFKKYLSDGGKYFKNIFQTETNLIVCLSVFQQPFWPVAFKQPLQLGRLSVALVAETSVSGYQAVSLSLQVIVFTEQ